MYDYRESTTRDTYTILGKKKKKKKEKKETRIKRRNEKRKRKKGGGEGDYIRIFVFDKFSLFHPRITGDGFLTRV